MSAEQVVSFLLQNVSSLLIQEANLLQGVREELQNLQSELGTMNALLKDAEQKQHESATVKDWISKSRELAYEADDVLEKFAVYIGSQRRGGTVTALKRYACILNECYMRHKVSVEIQSLKTRVSTINQKFEENKIRAIVDKEGSSQQLRRTYSRLEEDDFVGLDSDVHMLVQLLVNQEMSNEQRVVSIIGMGGLGKTTLARRVYNHPSVQRHFSVRVWAYVPPKGLAKDILQGILIKIMPEKREDIRNWPLEELVRELSQVQQRSRCLFVLDDIWKTDAWNDIKPAFCLKDQGSKMLLTSRKRDVVLNIDPNGFHHELQLLRDDESWKLFQKVALRRRYAEGNKDIKKMEEIGRKVAEQCDGLPIAVVVLGGILATKSTLSEWEFEYQNIHSNLGKGKGKEFQDGEVQKILGYSYNDLTYELKLCFLYLGGFPEGSEIDTETIYQLWLAEGFVPTMKDAESVLGGLAERSMVLVKLEDQFPTRRRFESCRLHDLMRDLCLRNAEEENFMRVINHSSIDGNEMVLPSSSASLSVSNRVHRLVVYADPSIYPGYGLPEKEMRKHARMLKLDLSEQYERGMEAILRSKFKNYEMLRILSLENFKYYELSNSSLVKSWHTFSYFKLSHVLGKLIHMRYLSLRGCKFPVFLPSLGNLVHLQTLDLGETEMMWFPNALGNMRELKHLYLSSSKTWEKPRHPLRLNGLSKLEILENFSDLLCEARDLLELANLRVFTMKQSFVEIDSIATVADYISSSNSLQYTTITLDSLRPVLESEKWPLILQKLLCARSMKVLHIEGPAEKFAKYEASSASLAGIIKVCFRDSYISEDPMEILENLPNLRELELKGAGLEEMVCHSKGFLQLRSLKLIDFFRLRSWIVEKGAMPNLSSLQLLRVPHLNELPDGLKVIETLKDVRYSYNVPESLKEQIRALSNMRLG